MNQRKYTIEINGVQESISQLDALLAKLEDVEQRLNALKNLKVETQVGVSTANVQSGPDASSMQEQAAAAREVTSEVQRQAAANQENLQALVGINQAQQEQNSLQNEALAIATAILGSTRELAERNDVIAKQLEEMKGDYKEIEVLETYHKISADEATKRRAELVEKETALKAERSKNLQLMKTEQKMLDSQDGSYEHMSQVLSRLKQAMKSIAPENLTDDQFQKMNAAITEMDEKVKAAAASMGEFQRNVGNYKSAFDGIEGIKLKIGETEAVFSSAREAGIKLQNAMTALELEGKKDTAQYREYEEAMRDVKKAQESVKDSMERAKDASKGLHDSLELFEGVTSIATIGQGLENLFGVDDIEVQEKINKMTALMGVLQGINKLRNQMNTGTGIGPMLNKLFDFAGNSPVAMLKNTLSALKAIPAAASTASASMGGLTKAVTAAKVAMSALWKATVIGFAASLAMDAIEGIIDGVKSLGNWLTELVNGYDAAAASSRAFEAIQKNETESLKKNLKLIQETGQLHGLSDQQIKMQQLEKQTESAEHVQSAFNAEFANTMRQANEWLNMMGYGNFKMPEVDPDGTQLKAIDAEIDALLELQKTGNDVDDELEKKRMQLVFAYQAFQSTIDMGNAENRRTFKEVTDEVNNLDSAIEEVGKTEGFADLINHLKQLKEIMYQTADAAFYLDEQIAQNEIDLDKKIRQWQIDAMPDRQAQRERLKDWYDNEVADLRKKNVKDVKKAQQAIEALDDAYAKKLADIDKRGMKSNKSRVSSADQMARQLEQIERQIQRDKIALMRDGLTKTLALIDQEKEERLKALEAVKKSSEYERLLEETQAIFSQKAAEATSKWVENWRESENEHLKMLNELDDKWQDLIFDRRKLADENKHATDEFKLSEATMKDLLHDKVEEYQKYIAIVGEYNKAWKDFKAMQDELGKKQNEMNELNAAGDVVGTGKVIEEIKKLLKEADELGKKADELEKMKNDIWAKVVDFQVTADDPKESLRAFMDYYSKLYDINKKFYEDSLQLEIDQEDQRFAVIKRNLIAEQEAREKDLTKKYEAFSADTKALEEKNMTDKQAIAEYNSEIALLRQSYNHIMKEEEEKHEKQLNSIQVKGLQERKKRNKEYFTDLLNAMIDYDNEVEKRASGTIKRNTNDWGIVNVSKVKKEMEEAKEAIKKQIKDLREMRASARVMFASKLIDENQFHEIEKAIKAELDQLDGDLEDFDQNINDALETTISAVNQYLQTVGSSIATLFSSLHDYYSNQLDYEEKMLNEQKDMLEEKLQEQEEVTRKHKEAIDEIEDELVTARGDRRDALIDQLNAQIAAQRASLAAEQRMQKQKEALEKREKALENERNKLNQKNAKTQAIISAALATANGYATAPFIPVGLAMGTLAAALGATQVALISAQKYAKGGEINGPSHAKGGVQIEAEGGEYVINRRSYSQNQELVKMINQSSSRLTLADFENAGYVFPDVDIQRENGPIIVSSQEPIYVSVVDINNAQDRLARVREMAG